MKKEAAIPGAISTLATFGSAAPAKLFDLWHSTASCSWQGRIGPATLQRSGHRVRNLRFTFAFVSQQDSVDLKPGTADVLSPFCSFCPSLFLSIRQPEVAITTRVLLQPLESRQSFPPRAYPQFFLLARTGPWEIRLRTLDPSLRTIFAPLRKRRLTCFLLLLCNGRVILSQGTPALCALKLCKNMAMFSKHRGEQQKLEPRKRCGWALVSRAYRCTRDHSVLSLPHVSRLSSS